MGIVNVTPDSFSDGGAYLDAETAIRHGVDLADAGAAVIDVGGESTRPGADPVAADGELRRVLPVIGGLVARTNVPVSIDTTKSAVARRALDAGARMVNDVSGGSADADMLRVVAESGAAYVAMHTRGTPRTMRDHANYTDVVREVAAELHERVRGGLAAGIDPRAILADPGIGFAKTAEHNLALLRALPELTAAVGVPMLIGTSRKSFLARVVGTDDQAGREDATLATTVWCFEQGAALVRVHDVAGSRRAVELLDVVERSTPEGIAA